MIVYESAHCYIQTGTSIKEKITKIDAIISALYDTAAQAALDDNITEFQLNDGQTTIKTIYKGADAVFNSITKLEHLRAMMVVQYNKRNNGSITRLVDSKNFRNGR